MKKNTTELPEVELTIKDYGDSVLVIVHHPHHWDGEFYFDNEKDAENGSLGKLSKLLAPTLKS